MKILLINNYHYRKGGADAVYFNTAKLLSDNEHEVFFFSLQDQNTFPDKYIYHFPKSYNFQKLSFLSKLIVSVNFIYNIKARKKLLKYIEEIKPDIAHIHLFMGGLTVSILKILHKKKIPIIHSVHDYRLICPSYLFLDGSNNICEKCKGGKFMNCILNRCSGGKLTQSIILSIDAYFRKYFFKPEKYINMFLFVSKFIRDKHVDFKASFQQKNIVLYNFIPNIDEFKPSEKKGNYFLFFGRLSREKGVLTLLEAAKLANINIKIVGTGTLVFPKELSENKKIEFLGYKTGNELWEIIRNASFVVVPSEWYENNPLSIIEAYSLGKPIIGADIGGIKEIIQEGKTGFLFPSGSKEKLAEKLWIANSISDEEYKIMSVHSRLFALNNFHPNKYLIELLNIYNKTNNLII